MSEVVVTEFQAMIAGLADDVARVVLDIWERLQAHLTDIVTALDAIVAAINRANAVATGLADVSVSAQIEVLSGTPTLPSAVAPVDDTERLTKAVRTIADSDSDTAMQLSRLARSEPLDTAQRVTLDAMAAQDAVSGWVRQLNAEACELCRWWARDGRVWPKDHKFPRHPGCNCQPRIVLTHKESQNA